MNAFTEWALMTRDEQKQRTRLKVIAAARALFADPGYDKTTIRMIAEHAGVATGSVFTTFASLRKTCLAR
jgi:AcrR family transcriptional regulator